MTQPMLLTGKEISVLRAFEREGDRISGAGHIAFRAWHRKDKLERKRKIVRVAIRRLAKLGFIKKAKDMIYDRTVKTSKEGRGAYILNFIGWTIAEAGIKHLQDFERAQALVRFGGK